MTVGHNKIRQLAMGNAQRAAAAQEIERMKQLLRQGLGEGAYGMTLGLEGVPGRWSDTSELVELAKVVAEHNAFYHAHQRAEGRSPRWWNASTPGDPVDGIEATRETLEWGSGRARASWRRTGEHAQGAVRAREGEPGEAAHGSGAGLQDPPRHRIRDHEGRWSLRRAHRRASERVYRGKWLSEIAALHGEDPVDAAIRLQMEGGTDRAGGGAYRGKNVSETEAIVRKGYVAYCTDGGAVPFGEGFPHPRYYGIFARILRQYVSDRKIIELPFAIRAMTSLPASIIGLKDRGVLREGAWADITVVDPLTVRPNSTYMKPHVYPTGFRYVMVNGELVVDEGALTNRLPGKVLLPPWTKRTSSSSAQ